MKVCMRVRYVSKHSKKFQNSFIFYFFGIFKFLVPACGKSESVKNVSLE